MILVFNAANPRNVTCPACGLIVKEPGRAYVALGGVWCECPEAPDACLCIDPAVCTILAQGLCDGKGTLLRPPTCPGRPVCPYSHCRKCGECPIVNGFGAFGHCAACLDGAPITTRVINREEYEAPVSRTDETPTETKTDA